MRDTTDSRDTQKKKNQILQTVKHIDTTPFIINEGLIKSINFYCVHACVNSNALFTEKKLTQRIKFHCP